MKILFSLFCLSSFYVAASPIIIDVDASSALNFTHSEDASDTTISITDGSSVNFEDQSNPGGAPISISSDSTLTFAETIPITYSGVLTGSGTVVASGANTLSITNNNSGFTGLLKVLSGTVNLDGAFGGSVAVSPGAIIVYNGPISGDLNITGGTITTAGVATLQVAGNYTQSSNAIYLANINLAGQSSLIQIAGTASITGIVQYNPIDGVLIKYFYKILEASGGVTGTFTIVNSGLLNAYLTSDLNDVYLHFEANIASAAQTPNQLQVANQLDQLIPTNVDETLVLNEILVTPLDQASSLLNVLSGEQYSGFFLNALYNSRSLSNAILEAARDWIDPCAFFDSNRQRRSWVSGSGGKGILKGSQNAPGFKTKQYNVSAGTQGPVADRWSLGGTVGYTNDLLDSNVPGKATLNTGNIGLYSVYEFNHGYLLLDLIGARTWGNFVRPVRFGLLDRTARSHPHLAFGKLDLQCGVDFGTCDWFFQPYLGVSGETYYQSKIKEKGAGSLNLSILPIRKSLASTQLGFYTRTDKISYVAIALDIYWQHYYGNLSVNENTRFQSFGSSFPIQGVKMGHDGGIATLSIRSSTTSRWEGYLDIGGELWKHWHSFAIGGGISYRW